MPATTPTVWRCAAILLMALALTACAGTPQQQTHQKIEWLIVAAAAATAALSSDSSSSSGGGTVAATPTNIVRAPTYTPDGTLMAYRRGDPDSFYMAGCTGMCYTDADDNPVNVLESAASVYPDGVPFLHRRIQGPRSGVRGAMGIPRISVPEPPLDVRQAWRDGWTGQGVNMLIVDSFGAPRTIPLADLLTDQNDIHGYTVLMSALEVAPNANYYALENGIGNLDYGDGGVRSGDETAAPASTKFHVVNHSFGFIRPTTSSPLDAPTQAQINAAAARPSFRDLLGSDELDTADAVITKAAGNENLDTGRFADAVALATHASTAPRVLFVGALNSYARASNPQSQPNVRTDARLDGGIHYDSNYAGSNVEIQSRFLVEYGGTPFGESAFLCDATVLATDSCRNAQTLDLQPFSANQGTSFAAPRVAGFVALVRDKFPSLSGAHTANTLLETATTMGLACHTGTARKSSACARNVYGQGRVDIGAALAPIGSLR